MLITSHGYVLQSYNDISSRFYFSRFSFFQVNLKKAVHLQSSASVISVISRYVGGGVPPAAGRLWKSAKSGDDSW